MRSASRPGYGRRLHGACRRRRHRVSGGQTAAGAGRRRLAQRWLSRGGQPSASPPSDLDGGGDATAARRSRARAVFAVAFPALRSELWPACVMQRNTAANLYQTRTTGVRREGGGDWRCVHSSSVTDPGRRVGRTVRSGSHLVDARRARLVNTAGAASRAPACRTTRRRCDTAAVLDLAVSPARRAPGLDVRRDGRDRGARSKRSWSECVHGSPGRSAPAPTQFTSSLIRTAQASGIADPAPGASRRHRLPPPSARSTPGLSQTTATLSSATGGGARRENVGIWTTRPGRAAFAGDQREHDRRSANGP